MLQIFTVQHTAPQQQLQNDRIVKGLLMAMNSLTLFVAQALFCPCSVMIVPATRLAIGARCAAACKPTRECGSRFPPSGYQPDHGGVPSTCNAATKTNLHHACAHMCAPG